MMLKKILVPIIILAVIISGIVLSKVYMNKETQEMTTLLERCEKQAKDGEEEKARESLDEFHKKWEINRKVVCTFIRHSEIDIANQSETKLPALLSSDDKTEFYAEVNMLSFQIKHINETDKYTLDNIF